MIDHTDASQQWLLVSDIDDTLTGNRQDLERLWRHIRDCRPALRLALNSSRPAGSVDRTISDYFPEDFEPDAIITGLGTEIRVAGGWLESWRRRFTDWPDREIRKMVTGLGFEAHEPGFQTEGKASFAVPGQPGVDRILTRLNEEGIAFRYIYSGSSDLDILAPGAGKDAAMLHLAEHLGIDAQRTVAAGDSGNDLALFEAAGKAIAVGNARQELIDTLPRHKTYLAAAKHAAGVLEGLMEFGLVPKS